MAADQFLLFNIYGSDTLTCLAINISIDFEEISNDIFVNFVLLFVKHLPVW